MSGESGSIMPQRLYKGKTMQDGFALTVSGGATPEDTSDEFVVRGAQEVNVQVENGDSTDLDVFVFVSFRKDGNFTTVPYASMNLGADESDQVPLQTGFHSVKIKIVNNDAVNATVVTTGVGSVWR